MKETNETTLANIDFIDYLKSDEQQSQPNMYQNRVFQQLKEKKKLSKSTIEYSRQPNHNSQNRKTQVYLYQKFDQSLKNQQEKSYTINPISLSFPRSERFQQPLGYSQDTPLIINYETGFKKKGITFGESKRSQFHSEIVKKQRFLPSPFSYFKQTGARVKVKKCLKCKQHLNRSLPPPISQSKQQCTFGLPYLKNKLTMNDFTPAVGSYDMKYDTIKKKSYRCTIIPRRTMFNSISVSPERISPTTYKPSYTQTQIQRYKEPNLGFGKKLDLAKPLNLNPGPGSYFLKDSSFKSEKLTSKEDYLMYTNSASISDKLCTSQICSVTKKEMYINCIKQLQSRSTTQEFKTIDHKKQRKHLKSQQ